MGDGLMAVKKGDCVAVDYLGYLDNGKVFDTSIEEEAKKAGLPLRPSYEPLEFTAGAGQMIKGFDDAVMGMNEGDEKTVHIEAVDAYGERCEELLLTVDKANVGGAVEKGMKLQSPRLGVGTVIEVKESVIIVDFNPELAGKALNFKIMLKKIKEG